MSAVQPKHETAGQLVAITHTVLYGNANVCLIQPLRSASLVEWRSGNILTARFKDRSSKLAAAIPSPKVAPL